MLNGEDDKMDSRLIKTRKEMSDIIISGLKHVTTPGKVMDVGPLRNDCIDTMELIEIDIYGRTIIQIAFMNRDIKYRVKTRLLQNKDTLIHDIQILLGHMLHGDVDFEYPMEFYKCVAIIMKDLGRGYPMSLELLASIATREGISEKHLTDYNMVYRSLLYKLKLCRFLVHSDDEEFDNKKNIRFVIQRTKDILPYVDYLTGMVFEESIKEYPEPDPEYVNISTHTAIKKAIVDIYTTSPLAEIDANEFAGLFEKLIKASAVELKSPVHCVTNVLRQMICEYTSESKRIKAQSKGGIGNEPIKGVRYGVTTSYNGPISAPRFGTRSKSIRDRYSGNS